MPASAASRSARWSAHSTQRSSACRVSSGESGATIEQVSAAVTAKRSTWRSGISRAMTSTWVPVTVPACQASSTSGQAPSRVARFASRRASAVEARPRWRRKAAIEPKPSTSYCEARA